MKKLCECGCGENIEKLDPKGRERRYKNGHQNINKINHYVLPHVKVCNECKKEKEINEFNFRNYKACNSSIYQRPRSKCKLCENKLASDWQRQPATKVRRREQKRNDRSIKSLMQNRIAAWKKKTPNSDLTTEYLLRQYDAQDGKCYYTGLPLQVLKVFEWKDKFEKSISLDRLDPDKGYRQGNVVFCLYAVNTMKGRLNEKDFYEKLKQILTNRGQL